MRQAGALGSISCLVSLGYLDFIETCGYIDLRRSYHADDFIFAADWIPVQLTNTQDWKERNTLATV